MHDVLLLVSGILKIIHPEQYTAAMATFEELCQRRPMVMTSVLTDWSNPFSALSTIANRLNKPHTDTLSAKTMYDVMLTLGGDPDLQLQLLQLGIQLPYQDRTMVAMSARLLQHAVALSKVERLCIVWYMREGVLRDTGNDGVQWPVHHK